MENVNPFTGTPAVSIQIDDPMEVENTPEDHDGGGKADASCLKAGAYSSASVSLLSPKEDTRERSNSLGCKGSRPTLKTHTRSYSDGGGRRRRPAAISIADIREQVHLPACSSKNSLVGATDLVILICSNLADEDPYIRLITIVAALEALIKTPLNRSFLLTPLAKALDRLPAEMSSVVFAFSTKHFSSTKALNPCTLLSNPETLLSQIKSQLSLSPKYIFQNFSQKYKDKVLDDLPNVGQEFFERVLKATSCASYIDGWDEPKIHDEFRIVWGLLTPAIKQEVRDLITADTTIQDYHQAYLTIMEL